MTINTDADIDPILLNSFIIRRKRHRCILRAGTIIWEREGSIKKSSKLTIPLTDIIAICTPCDNNNYCDDDHNILAQNQGQHSQSIIDNKKLKVDCNQFSIKYCRLVHPKKRNWRIITTTLYNNDIRIIQQWVQHLRSKINGLDHRPKRLLLFVNPFCGRKRSMHIYNRYVKSIFKLADIEISCIVSQRQNQIRDMILTQSLDHYDGVVCVGGDGTVSEVFNGLVFRALRDNNIDFNDPSIIEQLRLPQPHLPVGIIPAGSTDTIAHCLYGTIDAMTAAIHIALGATNGLDLASVCTPQGGLQRFYASVLSYGFLGDIAADSEKYRWMGPKRYDYSGFKNFFSNHSYAGELTLSDDATQLKYDDKQRGTSTESLRNDNDSQCFGANSSCSQCKLVTSELSLHQATPFLFGDHENNDQQLAPIRIISGNFFMVVGANLSCRCYRSPNGFSRSCHMGDGNIDLILVRHTTFFNNLRLLLALSRESGAIERLPFVEIYRTKYFEFRAQPPKRLSLSSSAFGAFSNVVCVKDGSDDEINAVNEATLDKVIVVSDNVSASTFKSFIDSSTSQPDYTNETSSTVPEQQQQPPSSLSLPIAETHNQTQSDRIKNSVWNCDGEVIKNPDLLVRSHRQLIRVYMRNY